ncbi:MAG: hypothetical protein K6G61_07660 [Solobacterium sp.]|nr:hypothetical protein [Solobacterium sp.]
MAVSDLSAEGAPSAKLASQLNALFGPCAVVSVMAVCAASAHFRSKVLKAGIYAFAAMLTGPLGTALALKAVFGLFERFSTFSAVVFNAVLGWYLYTGRFETAQTE